MDQPNHSNDHARIKGLSDHIIVVSNSKEDDAPLLIQYFPDIIWKEEKQLWLNGITITMEAPIKYLLQCFVYLWNKCPETNLQVIGASAITTTKHFTSTKICYPSQHLCRNLLTLQLECYHAAINPDACNYYCHDKINSLVNFHNELQWLVIEEAMDRWQMKREARRQRIGSATFTNYAR